MHSAQNEDFTALLRRWSENGESVAEVLAPLVYNEMRRLVSEALRANHFVVHPTALIHRAWVRLVESNAPSFRDRKQFYALASGIVRQILAAHARSGIATAVRGLDKVSTVDLMDALIYTADNVHAYLALHEVLEELAKADKRKLQIVELRFFAGLTLEEIAAHLQMQLRILMRELRFSEAWVSKQLSNRSRHEPCQNHS